MEVAGTKSGHPSTLLAPWPSFLAAYTKHFWLLAVEFTLLERDHCFFCPETSLPIVRTVTSLPPSLLSFPTFDLYPIQTPAPSPPLQPDSSGRVKLEPAAAPHT